MPQVHYFADTSKPQVMNSRPSEIISVLVAVGPYWFAAIPSTSTITTLNVLTGKKRYVYVSNKLKIQISGFITHYRENQAEVDYILSVV